MVMGKKNGRAQAEQDEEEGAQDRILTSSHVTYLL